MKFKDNLKDDISDDNLSDGNLSDGNLSDGLSPDNKSYGYSPEKNKSNENNKSSENNPYKLITRRIDAMKIRNHQKKELDVVTSVTSDINITKDMAVRSGAIIYTREGDKTFFCLGVDTQSGNLTDFGGGVKKGETIVDGGLRELYEESLGVFGNIMSKDILDTTTVHCFNMAIIFIPLNVDKNLVTEEFRQLVKDKETSEVCDIVWMSTDELMESIHGRGKKLYIRVRRLLNKVTNTISELC